MLNVTRTTRFKVIPMKHTHLIASFVLLACALMAAGGTPIAQTKPALSAAASDPNTMGSMSLSRIDAHGGCQQGRRCGA